MDIRKDPGTRPKLDPFGLVLVFLAGMVFVILVVLSLSSSFRSELSASSARPAEERDTGSLEAPSPQKPDSSKVTGQLDIQPFDVFCKKALARVPGQRTTLPHIDLPGMVQAIYDQKFSFLESSFSDCQRAYEEGRMTDAEMDYAHWLFANSDPRIDPLLTEWIGLYSKTPFSWLARARHRRSLAEHERGGAWAKDTEESNFRKMNYLLVMAQQDYVQALDLNPRLSFAYTGMMYAAELSGAGFSDALFAKGLKNNPDSVVLWDAMLHASQPKWGGSLEEMDQILSAASRSLKNPDNLRTLKADYYKYKGDHARQVEKDQTAADVFYKQMFEHMGSFGRYRYLGKKQKTWKDALPYYQKALALDPFSIEILRAMSSGLLALKQSEKALVYADVAIFLDSLDPSSLRVRGEIHEEMGNFDAAIKDYKNSLVYEPNSSFANMHLGHLLDAIKGRSDEAAPYLMQALLEDPQSPSVLYTLGLNEETRRDCSVLKTSTAYLDACNRGGATCSPHGLQWARTVGSRMKSRGLCR